MDNKDRNMVPLERHVDAQFRAFEKSIDDRFTALNTYIDERFRSAQIKNIGDNTVVFY